jgi:type VI secretion system protein ImpM
VTAPAGGAAAGWYGKIPALGDFASRRLPPDFIGAWDGWLQGAMLASRAALGEHWLATYLNSPIWRYLLLPGACGPGSWTGIMLPSVDKLGRQFPLTVATALDAQPEAAAAVFAAHGWFRALEQVALDSLSLDATVDALELALAATPWSAVVAAPRWPAAAQALGQWWAGGGATPIVLRLADADAVPAVIDGGALHALAEAGFGRSLWWTRDEVAGSAALLAFRGMPPDEYFSILLAGGPGPA